MEQGDPSIYAIFLLQLKVWKILSFGFLDIFFIPIWYWEQGLTIDEVLEL